MEGIRLNLSSGSGSSYAFAEWYVGKQGRAFAPFAAAENREKKTMDRQQAHQLLDRLGPAQFIAVAQLLEVLATEPEPLLVSLSQAPVEEEEITAETAAALGRARASLARGEGIPHDEILREFGLTK